MFNIFKSKKFDIAKALQDNVSFQLLPASVYDDAGNEYFLQLQTTDDYAKISYKANVGPVEMFKAYGSNIPEAIKNIHKLNIYGFIGKSRLRNPESEYELKSVKDFIDSFKKDEEPVYKLTPEQLAKHKEFLESDEYKDYAQSRDRAILDYLNSDAYKLKRNKAKQLDKYYNELESPSSKGPESEDDLINKADTKYNTGSIKAGYTEHPGENIANVDDLPGIGGAKFTIKVDKDMFKNTQITDIVEELPINISRKDLINALERSIKKKYSKKIKNI